MAVPASFLVPGPARPPLSFTPSRFLSSVAQISFLAIGAKDDNFKVIPGFCSAA